MLALIIALVLWPVSVAGYLAQLPQPDHIFDDPQLRRTLAWSFKLSNGYTTARVFPCYLSYSNLVANR